MKSDKLIQNNFVYFSFNHILSPRAECMNVIDKKYQSNSSCVAPVSNLVMIRA